MGRPPHASLAFLASAAVWLVGCDRIWGADFADAQLLSGGRDGGGSGGVLDTGGGGADATCGPGFPDSTPLCVSDDGTSVDCRDAPACAGHWVDAGPPDRFRLVGDDISDEATGLLWRPEVLDDSEGTIPPCPSGYELPTRLELLSIVDYGRASPAVDDEVFFGQNGLFVTGPETASGPWIIDFADGRAFRSLGQTGLHARCKKGKWEPGFEVDELDAEVARERSSGLAFRREPIYATGVFDAADKCAYLPPAPCGPWRAPSVKEMLLAIADVGGVLPVFESFDGAGNPRPLTSSPELLVPGAFWALHLRSGDVTEAFLSSPAAGDYAVYCVSGGTRH